MSQSENRGTPTPVQQDTNASLSTTAQNQGLEKGCRPKITWQDSHRCWSFGQRPQNTMGVFLLYDILKLSMPLLAYVNICDLPDLFVFSISSLSFLQRAGEREGGRMLKGPLLRVTSFHLPPCSYCTTSRLKAEAVLYTWLRE